MRNIKAIALQELGSLFASWRAYIVITVFMAVTGIFFSYMMMEFSNVSISYSRYMNQPGMEERFARFNINDIVVVSMFANMNIILLFIIPAVTMRLLSEEKKKGTAELLLTSPISETQLVAGKFLGGLGMVAVLLASTFLIPLFLFAFAEPEWGPVLTGYTGLFLAAGAFTAVGLFCSSLTRNQIVAMVLTFGILFVFYIIGWTASAADPGLGKIISHLSFTEHYESFSKGVLNLKDTVYYLSVTFLALFFTYQAILSRRWR